MSGMTKATTKAGKYSMAVTCSTGTITLSADLVSYVKIDRMVTVAGRVSVESVSSPAGTPLFSLPFAVGAESEQETHVAGMVRSNANFSGTTNALGLYTLAGQSYFNAEELVDNTEPANLNAANVVAGDHFTFGFAYFTDL